MSTIKDVARLAGVGTGTVSRVINAPHCVAPDTRQKVERAIAVLGYRPNLTARSLARGRSMIIALVFPDISSAYFPALTRGVNEVAAAAGYSVLIGCTGGRPAEEEKLIGSMGARPVDGVLVVPTGSTPPSTLPANMPIVEIEGTWPGISTDCVQCDPRGGVRRAVNRLIDLGHRQILYLGGPTDLPALRARRAGFIDAMASVGGPVPGAITVGPMTVESGYRRTTEWLRSHRPITAVIGASDYLAAGAIRALQEFGLKVPGDVSVTGYGNSPISLVVRPSLSTVELPAYTVGQEAASLLLARLGGWNGPVQMLTVEGSLAVRESSGPAPVVVQPDAVWGG